ncbi:Ribosomal RNA large subunit methyltransferase N [Geitlerinema sp. FC II]|nr:Ribosomal RNA large subunit methyltransferase N [Geitlerinema sp. FC II]
MKWIYQHGISDFEEMSNLNKNLRAMLIDCLLYTSRCV